jgi:hypothetical protein
LNLSDLDSVLNRRSNQASKRTQSYFVRGIEYVTLKPGKPDVWSITSNSYCIELYFASILQTQYKSRVTLALYRVIRPAIRCLHANEREYLARVRQMRWRANAGTESQVKPQVKLYGKTQLATAL